MSSDQGFRKRPPERLADRYQVLAEIGFGASAITYRGWDERLQRPVAIKLLREHYAQDETFVRRFQREARSAASIAHGNVVDVYDFGQQDDVLFMVMQLVEGEDLKHLIQREAPLDLARVRSIITQMLDGLQAIHAAGIVHRDIKPQNVLIGRDGVARLTDFGVAQAEEDSGMTTAGTTVGTAAYMAPEQAQAGRITEATDVYAVGVVLYEMLTGFLPFNAPTPMAIMLEHIQAPPIPPSQRMPGRGISPLMDAVVLRALAKKPEERFPSADSIKQAVIQALEGRAYEGGQSTVVLPAAQGTWQSPHQPGLTSIAPRPPQRRMQARPVASQPVERQGSGLRGAVAGFLFLVLLAVAGGATWFAYDAWQEGQAGENLSPTATVPAVVLPTEIPAATDMVIEPLATEVPLPTDTPQPTATEVPTPTPEPTRTPEPTLTPEPAPTEEPVLIEPIDGTPLTTIMDENGAPEGAKDKPDKPDKKNDEKEKKRND